METHPPIPTTPIEILPCPYVNGFSADNAGVNFMLKKYEQYSDFVLFDDGKPSRCFRFPASVISSPESSLIEKLEELKPRQRSTEMYRLGFIQCKASAISVVCANSSPDSIKGDASTRKDEEVSGRPAKATTADTSTTSPARCEISLLTDVEQLGYCAEDILKMLADHVHNCQTPLRTKLCALIRPYLRTTEPDMASMDAAYALGRLEAGAPEPVSGKEKVRPNESRRPLGITVTADKSDSAAFSTEQQANSEQPEERTGLLPCPFCGEHLKPHPAIKEYFTHSHNGCFNQSMGITNGHFKSWNSRALVREPGGWRSVKSLKNMHQVEVFGYSPDLGAFNMHWRDDKNCWCYTWNQQPCVECTLWMPIPSTEIEVGDSDGNT